MNYIKKNLLPDLEINIPSLFNCELLKKMAQELEIIRAMEMCEATI
jgi:hypothetical protein